MIGCVVGGGGNSILWTTVLLRSLCVSLLLINKHLPHSLEEDAQVVPSKWQSMALTGWSVSCEGANQPPRICCSHKKQEQPSYEALSCVNQSDNSWVYGWSWTWDIHGGSTVWCSNCSDVTELVPSNPWCEGSESFFGKWKRRAFPFHLGNNREKTWLTYLKSDCCRLGK